jgi:hypothetical protein
MSDQVEIRPLPERGRAPVKDTAEPLPCLGGVGEVYDAMGGRLPAARAAGASPAMTAGRRQDAG